MTSLQQFLAKLEELSQLKKNWYSVAETFFELKEYCSGMAHLNRRLREGCDASGYNLNTLNRMVAVKEFYDSVKDSIPELKGIDPNTISFPSLEVVKRAYQVNSGDGEQLLLEVVSGRITFRNLRESYNSIFSKNTQAATAHQRARYEAMAFEQVAFETIMKYAQTLCEENRNVKIKKPATPSWPVDAVGYVDINQLHTGYKFVNLKNPNEPRERLEKLIQSTIFNANFFEYYWVVFSLTTGLERIDIFSRILDLLQIENVGIAVFPWGDGENARVCSLEIKKRPKGDTAGNWRGVLSEYQELYAQLCQTNPG